MDQELSRRVGILGGTFDPIHNGHLAIARIAKSRLLLDQVLFVPSARPPHKPNYQISPFADRCFMLESALQEEASFVMSQIEANRSGPSYTIDTLVQLHESLGNVELFFLIGSDAFAEIHTWKKYKSLTSYSHVAIFTRPGLNQVDPVQILDQYFSEYSFSKKYNSWLADNRHSINLINMEPVAVSSSELREKIKSGRGISFSVPPAVAAIIKKKGLYGAQGLAGSNET